MTAQKRLANSEPIPAGLTLLLQARKLIGQGWTQHADARDCEEQAVEPWSPHAVAWSLLGALVAALEAETAENEAFAVGQLAAACVALAAVIDHDLEMESQ